MLVSWPFAGDRATRLKGKTKRNVNSVPSLVVEEMIYNIGTVVAQERLTVSKFWKDT